MKLLNLNIVSSITVPNYDEARMLFFFFFTLTMMFTQDMGCLSGITHILFFFLLNIYVGLHIFTWIKLFFTFSRDEHIYTLMYVNRVTQRSSICFLLFSNNKCSIHEIEL